MHFSPSFLYTNAYLVNAVIAIIDNFEQREHKKNQPDPINEQDKNIGGSISNYSESKVQKSIINLIIQWNSRNKHLAGGEGFEPSTPNLGETASRSDSQFWVNFRLFLEKEYKPKYKHQLFNNAQKFSQCLINGDLSVLKTFTNCKRLNIMKALSALAKFSGTYERYKRLIKSYGLKWAINNDDLIIARLIKYADNANGNGTDALFNWIRAVKQQIPDFNVFMDFTVETGLRLDEAINSYRLIVELSECSELSKYYNSDRQVLEHFRFRALFIRRTKKAFMSFASNELIQRVVDSGFKPSIDIIKKRLQRAGLNLRFSDLRELYASRSVEYLRQPEIDFLQGRVSTTVFMTNYFNPTWISSLRKRALKNALKLTNLQSEAIN